MSELHYKSILPILLIACIAGVTSGMTYMSFNSGTQMYVGGHKINVVTDPQPKLYVDGEVVNLTTAGLQEKGDDATVYSDLPNLPGLTIRFYNNGGYSVVYEHNGAVSTFGTLSAEEQKQLNEHLSKTFQNVNQQIGQVQQQVSNMMQNLNKVFSQPGWPFVH